MKPTFISVPYKASCSNGLTEYNGIAKFSAAGIVIEFESKILGLIGGEVKEVRIGLHEILDIRFRIGIYRFFSRIRLRSKNYLKLSELPNTNGKVTLKIKRDDFERAREAVEKLNKEMTSHRENLPPAHTPVSVLFAESEEETEESEESKK